MILRARQHEIAFPRPALVMGIVNVTPDSFSDGGQFLEKSAAVEWALKLVDEGADIIDVGGESTRPGAEPVAEAEELRRILPVVEELAARIKIPISIDTIKPGVARAAVEAGASIINDIAGNRAEPEMWRVAAETGAAYVLVHIQGTPKTMQINPMYADVVDAVQSFFEERLGMIQANGIQPEQIILDAGIGFGKTPEHNLQLLANWRGFTKWNRPLLLGASRKSFLQRTSDGTMEERLWPSLACACWGAREGAQIIRCHDVAATRQALRMTEALAERKRHVEHS